MIVQGSVSCWRTRWDLDSWDSTCRSIQLFGRPALPTETLPFVHHFNGSEVVVLQLRHCYLKCSKINGSLSCRVFSKVFVVPGVKGDLLEWRTTWGGKQTLFKHLSTFFRWRKTSWGQIASSSPLDLYIVVIVPYRYWMLVSKFVLPGLVALRLN